MRALLYRSSGGLRAHGWASAFSQESRNVLTQLSTGRRRRTRSSNRSGSCPSIRARLTGTVRAESIDPVLKAAGGDDHARVRLALSAPAKPFSSGCCTTFSYRPRVGRFSASSRTRLCPHGDRPTACWTIVFSGHASANDRIYSRFDLEKPDISGNSARRSLASRRLWCPMTAPPGGRGSRARFASTGAVARRLWRAARCWVL